MLTRKTGILAGITVLFVIVVAASHVYGPSRRTYVATPQVLQVETASEVGGIWDSSGVRGRIAVCFTRYLNAVQEKETQDVKVTEAAMEKGIIRKVYHVPPGRAWPEIQKALSTRSDMRTAPEGFIGIFDYGRIYIQPLERLVPLTEKALVIIEPAVWNQTDLSRIAGMLQSGRVPADIVIIIRGSEQDAALFRTAVTGK